MLAASSLSYVDIEKRTTSKALLQASTSVAKEPFDSPSKAEVVKLQIQHTDKVPGKANKVEVL